MLEVLAPLAEHDFMRRALVACLALALAGGPIGTLMVIRRMSLAGDAISHALLPGAALGFFIGGAALPALAGGAAAGGVLVALLATTLSRLTPIHEDASLAVFYLVALAAGVLLVSMTAGGLDVLHLLFGSVLAVDDGALLLIAAIASLTLLVLAVMFRSLVLACLDPDFLRMQGGGPSLVRGMFLVLLVLNLVAGFLALGTLMAVGLLVLPAIAARYWAGTLGALMLGSSALALAAAVAGLLLSFHLDLPSGPAIVLAAGVLLGVSALAGPRGMRAHAPRARAATP